MLYDHIRIKISSSEIGESIKKIYLKIQGSSALATNTFNNEDNHEKNSSVKKNGIREYEHNIDKFLIAESEVEKEVDRILNEYKEGKKYVEVEWTGNPELILNKVFATQTPKRKSLWNDADTTQIVDGDTEFYIALSNEIYLDEGLRFKTKARQFHGYKEPKSLEFYAGDNVYLGDEIY